MVAATLFDSVKSDRDDLVIERCDPCLLINATDLTRVHLAVVATTDDCDVDVGRQLDRDHVQSDDHALVNLKE